MEDIIKDLNSSQQEAVMATEGPVMVVAGAGSGKTRVLTYRIAWLLAQGVNPFGILALTFTNKAAREMKERIAHLVGASKAKSIWMGTFHSIFARMLRVEAEKLGFPQNFTIYDTDDSKRVLKNIIKEQNLDDKTYNPGFVLGRISNAKNNLISPIDYNADFEIQNADIHARKPKLGLLYSLYQQRLRKSSAMDFDDLLYNTNVLLRDFPESLYRYQNKFSHILVDEYQDTNYSQYLIVKKLAAKTENVCVVGDDAQSIYAFRGANIANILNFKKDYPDCKTFKLEQNYRSTQTIVEAANSIIIKNKDQIFKKVWTENPLGEKILVYKAASEADEASWIANRVLSLNTENLASFGSFAVLYRTNSQSRSLEEAMRRLNVPYRIFGGISFYQRKEVKDVLAYFRLVINPNDEESLRRIINYPARGIGDTTLAKLEIAATEQSISLWEATLNAPKFGLVISSGILRRIEEFTTTIRGFSALLYKYNAFELGELIISKAGIRKTLLEDDSAEGIHRKESVEELMAGLQAFAEGQNEGATEGPLRTLDEFMQDIALLTDADMTNEDLADTSRVSLMTMHSAKGLEFPYVFLAGMEENLFPSLMALGSRADLEEERRLFYVGLTRAMKQASLTWAESRFRFGQFNYCEPSRFIEEIDPNFVQFHPGNQHQKFKTSTNFRSDDTSPGYGKKPAVSQEMAKVPQIPVESGDDNGYSILTAGQLQIQMKVMHQRFGAGVVAEIEGKGPDAKATIVFETSGKKELMLKYARLKIL